jgi:hypothetical protein
LRVPDVRQHFKNSFRKSRKVDYRAFFDCRGTRKCGVAGLS